MLPFFPSCIRSDYQDFIRDLSRHIYQLLAHRVDSYLASLIQVRVRNFVFPVLLLHYMIVNWWCRLLIRLGLLYKQMQFTSPVACFHFLKTSALWLHTVHRYGHTIPTFCLVLTSIYWREGTWGHSFYQVFAALVNKMSRSPDTVVRASCSFALGLLLKSFNPLACITSQLDRPDSIRSNTLEWTPTSWIHSEQQAKR